MEKSEETNLKISSFNSENLIKYLEEINASIGDIPTNSWNNAMLEFVKIFNSMGSAMSMAFSGLISNINQLSLLILTDITSKVAIIRRNAKYWDELSLKGGIITITRQEMGLRIHILNGENQKLAPDVKYKNYEASKHHHI